MRYFLKYKTSYKVARAEYTMAKQARAEWKARKAEHEKKKAAFKMKEPQVLEAKERMAAGEVLDQDYLESLPEDPGEFEEEEPEVYTFKDLQNMDVREFAERNKDLLREAYHAQREAGKRSKEAKKYVSTMWFGSE